MATVLGTGGGFRAGMMPLLEYSKKQLELNKLSTDVQTRGDVCAFNASNEAVKSDGVLVNRFAVALRDRANPSTKGVYAMPGSIVGVTVDAGQTATFGGPLTSTNGKVRDKGASAANLVCGWAMGTYDQHDGKVLMANVGASLPVLMLVREWQQA